MKNSSIITRNLSDNLTEVLRKRGLISQLLIDEGLFANGNVFACGGSNVAGGIVENAATPLNLISNFILNFLNYKPMNVGVFEGMPLTLRQALRRPYDKRIYTLKNEACYFLSGGVSEETLLATIKDAEYHGRFVCILSEGIRDVYDRQFRLIKEQQMRSLIRRARYIIVGIDGSQHGFLWSYEDTEVFASLILEESENL